MSDNKRPAPEGGGGAAKRARPEASLDEWNALLARVAPFNAQREEKEKEIEAVKAEIAAEKGADKDKIDALRKEIAAIEKAAEKKAAMLRAQVAIKQAEIEVIAQREAAELAGEEVWRIYNKNTTDLYFACEADARWAWDLLVAANLTSRFKEPAQVKIDDWQTVRQQVACVEARLADFLKPATTSITTTTTTTSSGTKHMLRVKMKDNGRVYVAAFHTRAAAEAVEAKLRLRDTPASQYEHVERNWAEIDSELRNWLTTGDAAAEEGLLGYIRRHT